jgi:hypothetical protein
MNKGRAGEDKGSKETDSSPLTVPSLPYMDVHMMAKGAVVSCGPIPMRVMKVTSLLSSLLIHSQSRLLRLRTSKQTR